ncbi:uncharacterized protein [Triticum aestivum]|uniref:uncharacterized protein n=1 Tax=Triticum aestivum TaxID=4565 RepID=UPI001D00592F|nr:uncharacterized protein LOC123115406 [Triticum aestivum]
MSAAGGERSDNRRTMTADPTSQDDPLALPEKKKKKVSVRRDEASLPDPDAWILSDADLARMERDQKSAPPPVKIPTLDYFKPPTRFHTAEVFAVRDSSEAALSAAKFLLGVSSSLDGEPLRRCSGFWVDWDEDKKTGLVLTTARLIRTKDSPDSSWSGGEEYAPRADVTVHLLNGTSAKGNLVYYQPHYDIAFLNVEVGQPIKLPSFREEDVKFAQDVFRLGRDDSLNLRITYARAEYKNPNMYRRYHNAHFRSPDDHGDDNEYDNGGLVIDLNENVVGMVNLPKRFGSFIPSSILLNCLDSWKKYRCIARPHLGMMFQAIKLLEPAHVDMLWRMYNIDHGLIVQEECNGFLKVSKGSNAEILGIQKGDAIESINGKPVSTTIELENTLMITCKGTSGAEVHISVGVFHTLKKQRSTIQWTAELSELGEVLTS